MLLALGLGGLGEVVYSTWGGVELVWYSGDIPACGAGTLEGHTFFICSQRVKPLARSEQATAYGNIVLAQLPYHTCEEASN